MVLVGWSGLGLGLVGSVFFDDVEELVALICGEVLVVEKAQHESGGRSTEDTGDAIGGHALGDSFLTDFGSEEVGICLGLAADILLLGHEIQHGDEGGVGEGASALGEEFANLADPEFAFFPEDLPG